MTRCIANNIISRNSVHSDLRFFSPVYTPLSILANYILHHITILDLIISIRTCSRFCVYHLKKLIVLKRIKLNRKDEFDMTKMTDRLKAPHIRYAQSVFLSDDPKE